MSEDRVDGIDGRADPAERAAAARLAAAGLAADGPDEMGRELAEGPAAVEATLAAVDGAMAALTELLVATRRTVLVGTGASLAVARTAAPLWRVAERQHGVERPLVVRESTAAALADADGHAFEAADLVIAISQSGTSPETGAAAGLAARAGSRLVALTAAAGSPLAGLASLALVTPSGPEEGAATKSELSALAALLAIPGALSSDAPTAAMVRARLATVVADWDAPAALGPALAAAERTWLIGLGTAAGLAGAAGLLWHEKAHRLAFPTTVSEFRHGPVEAARPGDAVLLVDVDQPLAGRRAYLDLLRAELDRLGARLVEISPELPDGAPGLRLPEPGAEAALQALLRLQQLARATAHAAGAYQDGFRVLRAIVTAASV
ncbi:MAG TPA: SIS domain-containing protein [Candidatus Limnocylindrales bacterium]